MFVREGVSLKRMYVHKEAIRMAIACTLDTCGRPTRESTPQTTRSGQNGANRVALGVNKMPLRVLVKSVGGVSVCAA